MRGGLPPGWSGGGGDPYRDEHGQIVTNVRSALAARGIGRTHKGGGAGGFGAPGGGAGTGGGGVLGNQPTVNTSGGGGGGRSSRNGVEIGSFLGELGLDCYISLLRNSGIESFGDLQVSE